MPTSSSCNMQISACSFVLALCLGVLVHGDPTNDSSVSVTQLAGAWIPFTVVVVLSLFFALTFVKYYEHTREKDAFSTIASTGALMVCLLTAALIPVDIFLVSIFKSSDGQFEDWATVEHRNTISNTVTYAYYTMYACNMLFVFLILPLAYFYFEEKDEVAEVTKFQRMVGACKYTLVFVVAFGILMSIGAFALNSKAPSCEQVTNSTDPQDWIDCKADFAEQSFTANGGANAISFTIGALTIFGFYYLIMYLATGLVALPLDMIKSRHKHSQEDAGEIEAKIKVSADKRASVTAKYAGKTKSKYSARDQDIVFQEQENERILRKANDLGANFGSGCLGKVAVFLRPFEFVFGIILLCLSVFIIVALIMSSGNKLMQITSQNLSFKDGYGQVTPTLINPVDALMTFLQKAFPLDYIFMTLLCYYFIIATIAGARLVDVRLFCLKMSKIRPSKTTPQGMLFMCLILVFVVLSLNVLLMTLLPKYLTYGNQKYPAMAPPSPNVTIATAVPYPAPLGSCDYEAPAALYALQISPITFLPNGLLQLNVGSYYNASNPPSYCTSSIQAAKFLYAPSANYTLKYNSSWTCKQYPSPCTQTRLAALLNAFFFNFWFLGAIFYWCNWAIICVFTIAFFYLVCRSRRSIIKSLINEAKEDADDDDDDLVPFNPSWLKK